jgi:hypothetical protein
VSGRGVSCIVVFLLGISCDKGQSFLDLYPESPASVAYLSITERKIIYIILS